MTPPPPMRVVSKGWTYREHRVPLDSHAAFLAQRQLWGLSWMLALGAGAVAWGAGAAALARFMSR
jgi:hypothetical protein